MPDIPFLESEPETQPIGDQDIPFLDNGETGNPGDIVFAEPIDVQPAAAAPLQLTDDEIRARLRPAPVVGDEEPDGEGFVGTARDFFGRVAAGLGRGGMKLGIDSTIGTVELVDRGFGSIFGGLEDVFSGRTGPGEVIGQAFRNAATAPGTPLGVIGIAEDLSSRFGFDIAGLRRDVINRLRGVETTPQRPNIKSDDPNALLANQALARATGAVAGRFNETADVLNALRQGLHADIDEGTGIKLGFSLEGDDSRTLPTSALRVPDDVRSFDLTTDFPMIWREPGKFARIMAAQGGELGAQFVTSMLLARAGYRAGLGRQGALTVGSVPPVEMEALGVLDEALNRGIDPQTALSLAVEQGTFSFAVERAQLGLLIPRMRSGARGAVVQSFMRRMSNRTGRSAAESMIEAIQEAHAAALVTDDEAEILRRTINVMPVTFLLTLLLPGSGRPFEHQTHASQRRQARIEENRDVSPDQALFDETIEKQMLSQHNPNKPIRSDLKDIVTELRARPATAADVEGSLNIIGGTTPTGEANQTSTPTAAAGRLRPNTRSSAIRAEAIRRLDAVSESFSGVFSPALQDARTSAELLAGLEKVQAAVEGNRDPKVGQVDLSDLIQVMRNGGQRPATVKVETRKARNPVSGNDVSVAVKTVTEPVTAVDPKQEAIAAIDEATDIPRDQRETLQAVLAATKDDDALLNRLKEFQPQMEGIVDFAPVIRTLESRQPKVREIEVFEEERLPPAQFQRALDENFAGPASAAPAVVRSQGQNVGVEFESQLDRALFEIARGAEAAIESVQEATGLNKGQVRQLARHVKAEAKKAADDGEGNVFLRPTATQHPLLERSAPSIVRIETKFRRDLQSFRELVRSRGIKPDRHFSREDFGKVIPPGIFKNDARLTWDQWAEQAVDLDLLPPNPNPQQFMQLFLGSVDSRTRSVIELDLDAIASAEVDRLTALGGTDNRAVNETELDRRDLVFKNGEWHLVQRDSDGRTTLKDGTEIDLDHFENVDVSTVVRVGDPGYEEALAAYREQESRRSGDAGNPVAREPVQLLNPRIRDTIKHHDRRPNAETARSEELALRALEDLGRIPRVREGQESDRPRSEPIRTGSGALLLGLGISRDLIQIGRVDLTGRSVRNPDELAQVAQVYRDPRFETFRVVWMKQGKVAAVEGVSARLPGVTPVFVSSKRQIRLVRQAEKKHGKNAKNWPEEVVSEIEKQAREDRRRAAESLNNRKQRLNADGYYLIHNHPSGDPTPSRDDVGVTRLIAGMVEGFLGHVVIDSGRYATLDSKGGIQTGVLESLGNDPLFKAQHPHDVLGEVIDQPEDAVRLADRVVQPGGVQIVYFTTKNAVRAVETVPDGLVKNTEAMIAHLRGRKRAYGAVNVILYGDGQHGRAAKDLIERGFVRDYIWSGMSLHQSGLLVGGRKEFLADDLIGRRVRDPESSERQHFGPETGAALNPIEALIELPRRLRELRATRKEGRKLLGERILDEVGGTQLIDEKIPVDISIFARKFTSPEFALNSDSIRRAYPTARRDAENIRRAALAYTHMTNVDRATFEALRAKISKKDQVKVRQAMEILHSEDPDKIEALINDSPHVAEVAQELIHWFANVREAVKATKLDTIRISIRDLDMRDALEKVITGHDVTATLEEIDQRRRQLDQPPLNREALAKLVEEVDAINDWGIDKYITNIELGHIRLVDADGVTRAIAVNKDDAKRKFRELIAEDPELGDITIETGFGFDEDALRSFLPREAVEGLITEIKQAVRSQDAEIAESLTRSDIRNALGNRISVKPKEPKRPFTGPLKQRRDILRGHSNVFEVLPLYSYAIRKYQTLEPSIVLMQKRIEQHKYPEQVRKLLVNMADTARGHQYLEDTIVDGLFRSLEEARRTWPALDALINGVQLPERVPIIGGFRLGVRQGEIRNASRAAAAITEIEANLKLGYRAGTALVNWLGGHGHTWANVGTKYLGKAKAWVDTPDGKAFLKREEGLGSLGLDFILETPGRTSKAPSARTGGRVPLSSPLGLFTRAERNVREINLAANYLYFREVHGFSEDAAAAEARTALGFQQFIYSRESVAEFLRSPVGRVAGQFKTFPLKSIEMLVRMSPTQIARYTAVTLAMAGPRGMIRVIRHFPLIAAFGLGTGWLDENERRLEAFFGQLGAEGLGAGLPGFVFGADMSAQFVPQLPQRMEDLAGPFFGDLWRFYKHVMRPILGDEPFTSADREQFFSSLSPAIFWWEALMDSVTDGNGYALNPRGQKAFPVASNWERALLVAGIPTLDMRDQQLALQHINREQDRVRRAKQKFLDVLVKNLIAGDPLNQQALDEYVSLGGTGDGLRDAYINALTDPRLRTLMQQPVALRQDAVRKLRDMGALDEVSTVSN